MRLPRVREGSRLGPYLGPRPHPGEPRPRKEGAQAGSRSGSRAPRVRVSLPHAFASDSAAFSVYLWRRPVQRGKTEALFEAAPSNYISRKVPTRLFLERWIYFES